jgi:hypothetical protein
MAPTSTGSTRNCTSCHGDYTVNSGGGGITLIGLPTIFTAGTSYAFSIKIAHGTADRKVWGYAIKAVDTTTNTVVGTWTSTNTNSSIKGAAGSASYELSHANAAVTTVANNYTYGSLTWNAPSVAPSKVKFFVSAVAGNNNGNEALDYVYTTTFSSAKYVAPPVCVFTYGTWTGCSNGTQIRTYTTSPAGCTGTPPADSISRTCTMPTGLPTPVTITTSIQPQTCDTIRTFTTANQAGVYYAWILGGAGNIITNGQGTNTISTIIKSSGSAVVSLSNATGSIPATSLAFIRAVPPTPSAITGTITPCIGSVITYTLTNPVPSATQVPAIKFKWSIPAFTSILSANADSSSINLSFNAGYAGGSLSAKGESTCGTIGGAKAITFSPTKAIDVISNTGFWNACIGNSVNYIVISPAASVTLPITVFRWTIPAFTNIISANRDSSVITLQFNTGFRGGALKVQSSTTCGALGVAVSKTLTHLNCAAGSRMGIEELQQDLVAIYPVPNNGNFTLNVQTGNTNTVYANINIIDMTGRVVYNERIRTSGGIFSKDFSLNLQRGMYALYYIINNKRTVIKFIVQ